MATARRMGPKGSDIWHSMLDAAEAILCEDGYGALTSRNVAERIGVKQRLVYYYFRTMDELIVETFRRLAEREILRFKTALEDEHPLKAVSNVIIDTTDTRLVSEFMALANRIEPLRIEVKNYIEESRKLEVEALEAAMKSSGSEKSSIAPVAAVIIASGTLLAIHREAEIGITEGHDEVRKVIADFIAKLDKS